MADYVNLTIADAIAPAGGRAARRRARPERHAGDVAMPGRGLALIRLSPTEYQVVALLAQGSRHEEIRLRLDISKHSITSALKRAREKTGAVTNEHLVALLYRAGVLQ